MITTVEEAEIKPGDRKRSDTRINVSFPFPAWGVGGIV
jgi:hypothetical protein